MRVGGVRWGLAVYWYVGRGSGKKKLKHNKKILDIYNVSPKN